MTRWYTSNELLLTTAQASALGVAKALYLAARLDGAGTSGRALGHEAGLSDTSG